MAATLFDQPVACNARIYMAADLFSLVPLSQTPTARLPIELRWGIFILLQHKYLPFFI